MHVNAWIMAPSITVKSWFKLIFVHKLNNGITNFGSDQKPRRSEWGKHFGKKYFIVQWMNEWMPNAHFGALTVSTAMHSGGGKCARLLGVGQCECHFIFPSIGLHPQRGNQGKGVAQGKVSNRGRLRIVWKINGIGGKIIWWPYFEMGVDFTKIAKFDGKVRKFIEFT